MNALFTEEEGSASFDRTIVFARMRPSKIMDRTNVPVAIANSDGSLYKANKSQTLKDIELVTGETLYYDDFMKVIEKQ